MAVSDSILSRLLQLHPKVIDLTLERMWRILGELGHPERALPPVIHVAGTNGKGSVVAYLCAIMEAAGLSVHCYTSPHLVRFHERIRLGAPSGSAFIDEPELVALLEECEAVNGGEPITYFEITTAAALLAFSRHPA
ncbi:MAG: bifunctional folylpolyglutamate synthase/dihydrofolate synthase, partial [Aestuariivirgaceae bacterium]